MKESQHYHVHSMLSNVVNSAMEGDQQQQQYRLLSWLFQKLF